MQTCPGGFTGMACIMRSWGSFVLNQYGFSSSGGVAGLFVGGYREISLPSRGGGGGCRKGLERERGTHHQKAPNILPSVYDIETGGSYG